MLCAVSAVAASVTDSGAGALGGRRAVLAMNQPMPVPADVPSKLLRTGSHNRLRKEYSRIRLALRPGFSAQARMPPTALLAPRGERRRLLVLTAGPVRYFYGRYPTGPVAASLPD